MKATLEHDDERLVVRDAVAEFCRRRWPMECARSARGGFQPDLWRELGALGVLALGTPEGEGGLRDAAAAGEALGAALAPGPWVETALAAPLLEASERRDLVEGVAIAGLGCGGLYSFAPDARWLFAVEEDGIFAVLPRGAIDPVSTLAGEVWGRLEAELAEPRGDVPRALAAARLAAASYLVGASTLQCEVSLEHARTRRQFGRTIGEFQAVSHSLVDAWIGVERAGLLVRQAAASLDAQGTAGAALAAAAWISARDAAREGAARAHQVLGAVGITLEGPLFAATRRIRQLASLPLGPGAHELLLARVQAHGAGVAEEG